MLTDG